MYRKFAEIDEKRMEIARVGLGSTQIPEAVCGIVAQYLLHSEELERLLKVFDMAPPNIGSHYIFGDVLPYGRAGRVYQWMGVCIPVPTQEMAEQMNISPIVWEEEWRYRYHLDFGDSYKLYDPLVTVDVLDLLPSRGLPIVFENPIHEMIADALRDSYLDYITIMMGNIDEWEKAE